METVLILNRCVALGCVILVGLCNLTYYCGILLSFSPVHNCLFCSNLTKLFESDERDSHCWCQQQGYKYNGPIAILCFNIFCCCSSRTLDLRVLAPCWSLPSGPPPTQDPAPSDQSSAIPPDSATVPFPDATTSLLPHPSCLPCTDQTTDTQA